jgi:hypothetical protein
MSLLSVLLCETQSEIHLMITAVVINNNNAILYLRLIDILVINKNIFCVSPI